jgi:hypothetical protein
MRPANWRCGWPGEARESSTHSLFESERAAGSPVAIPQSLASPLKVKDLGFYAQKTGARPYAQVTFYLLVLDKESVAD